MSCHVVSLLLLLHDSWLNESASNDQHLLSQTVDDFLTVSSTPCCFQPSVCLVYHTFSFLPQALPWHCMHWCLVVVLLHDECIVTCKICMTEQFVLHSSRFVDLLVGHKLCPWYSHQLSDVLVFEALPPYVATDQTEAFVRCSLVVIIDLIFLTLIKLIIIFMPMTSLNFSSLVQTA